MSSKTALKALRNFSGPDGKYSKGEGFKVSPTRANWLVDNGFAERVREPVEKVERPAPKITANE